MQYIHFAGMCIESHFVQQTQTSKNAVFEMFLGFSNKDVLLEVH